MGQPEPPVQAPLSGTDVFVMVDVGLSEGQSAPAGEDQGVNGPSPAAIPSFATAAMYAAANLTPVLPLVRLVAQRRNRRVMAR